MSTPSALRSGVLLLTTFLLPLLLLAQPVLVDVVYLKNGSIIRGVILEQIPNKTIRMQTADGNIFVFQMDEIERISKESAQQPTAQQQQQAGPAPEVPPRGVELILGGSFPSGVYSETNNNEAGYAKTGFVAGLQYASIGTASTFFSIGATYSMHKMDTGPLEQLFSSFGGANIDATSWSLIVPSMAFGFGGVSGDVHPYIAGMVGFAIVQSPELTVSTSSTTVTQPSAKGNAAAFGIVGGLYIGENLSLSVRYLSTKPKMKVTASNGQFSTTTEYEQPIGMIEAMLGVGF